MKKDKIKLVIEDSRHNTGAIFKDSITNTELCVADDRYFWKDCEYYHLYVVNDEQILNGDFYLLPNGETVQQRGVDDEYTGTAEILASSKIIATTNKYLISKGVDEINESFVKFYVDNYNHFTPITEAIYDNGFIITGEQINIDKILEDIKTLSNTEKLTILKHLVCDITTTDAQLNGLLNKISDYGHIFETNK